MYYLYCFLGDFSWFNRLRTLNLIGKGFFKILIFKALRMLRLQFII